MALRNIDVKIRYAYARLKRRIAIYFTLWFLALLAGVTLIIYSLFIRGDNLALKLWSTLLVLMLAVKLAYEASENMRRKYEMFKTEEKVPDSVLRSIDGVAKK